MQLPVIRFPIAVAFATCILGLTGVSKAAQDTHEHKHDHDRAAVENIKLNDGEKWATDESLRSGMSEIRQAFDTDHPAIRACS